MILPLVVTIAGKLSQTRDMNQNIIYFHIKPGDKLLESESTKTTWDTYGYLVKGGDK